MTQGYIYVLTNRSMPGIVKIGRTVRDPADRARELRSTGVPVHFELVYSNLVDDCEKTELQIHQILAKRGARPLSDREFFEVTAEEAIDLIHTVTTEESSSGPDFSMSGQLAEIVDGFEIPLGKQNISEEKAAYLAGHLTKIGRRGYPNALKICAGIFLDNQPSTAQFREHWQEYLTLAQSEAKWKRLDGANGRAELERLGRDASEYLELLHQRGWLLPIDFAFVSEYLVAGERFAYEGYLDALKRSALPASVLSQAENL